MNTSLSSPTSDTPADIVKAAGVIIRDRKLLVVREEGKSVFIAPGGKPEANETVRQALDRELAEELGMSEVTVTGILGVFRAVAAGNADQKIVEMTVYEVADPGEDGITFQSEIVDSFWLNSTNGGGREIGSIFEHDVLPLLVERNLVD
jgi:8-oxo-dGTP diphosphatase